MGPPAAAAPHPLLPLPLMPAPPDRRGILFFAAFVFGVLVPLLSHSGMFGRRNRTSLPQVISRKLADDRTLLEEDNSQWYRVDEEKLSPELARRFVRLSADEQTRAFIENSIERSDDVLLQLWHNLAKSVMKLFYYTQTDINGYLGRGSMFVLSRQQFEQLADRAGVRMDEGCKLERMVDLGAGDGCPTQAFVPFFSEVFATEASAAMRKALEARNISVLEVESWHEEHKFDFVSALNLLDRCAEPLSVLRQIKADDIPVKQSSFISIFSVLHRCTSSTFFPPDIDRIPKQKNSLCSIARQWSCETGIQAKSE